MKSTSSIISDASSIVSFSSTGTMKKRRAPPPPGQIRESNRSIDLDQSDVTDTYFDNQPVVHESPFNLQPIMVLGCKGQIQIEILEHEIEIIYHNNV